MQVDRFMTVFARAFGRLARLMTPDVAAGLGARTSADARPKTILITGAAGSVATGIRPLLSPHFDHVILTDVVVPFDMLDNESFQQADLGDISAMKMVCEGADAILHLGAASRNGSYDELKGPNLDGANNLFVAALEAGVDRVVFASTLHTHGFYSHREWFDEASPPRPDSIYAGSKLFGEAMAQIYAQKHGLHVAVLRIGAFAEDPFGVEPGNWIGSQDLADLCLISLTHPDIQFEVFHGVADYKGSPLGRSRAAKFGFAPKTSPESYADAVKRARQDWKQERAAHLRGASFTGDEETELF